jgi:hypothetical protein
MVEVITRLYAELAQSYMAQPLIIFLEAVCMAVALVNKNSHYEKKLLNLVKIHLCVPDAMDGFEMIVR